jgi:hypothetical protein
MNTTIDDIKNEIREIPLLKRLESSAERIGLMCKEGRPPDMSIPVRADDEDLFITTTLQDAGIAIAEKDARILALREALEECGMHAEIIQNTRWGNDGDCGACSHASSIEDTAAAALSTPAPLRLRAPGLQ